MNDFFRKGFYNEKYVHVGKFSVDSGSQLMQKALEEHKEDLLTAFLFEVTQWLSVLCELFMLQI
ncbi:hypothetical protein [Niallia endozanthoxylica]|uniref:hypothetical protein n=1 Tax=Niallia endozanthoxylica TaxID=2036016 RepID=UPI00168BB35A|nr:hypothetical protein [Niallia endozanthoxylica]